MPVLELGLVQGEKIISEPGRFSWMTPNIQLRTAAAMAGSTHVFGAMGRALSGGGLLMNEYQALLGDGNVAFAAKLPGSIVQIQARLGRSYMVHRNGFLCATAGVKLSTGFQRSLGVGIFGGTGLVLQKIAGDATAWVELGGEVISYTLPSGESLVVHPGHVGMFESNVKFEVVRMPGLKNLMFGGDGLFVVRLTGPGQVWLQTLTMPNLAHALLPYIDREVAAAASTGAALGKSAFGTAAELLGSLLGGSDKR